MAIIIIDNNDLKIVTKHNASLSCSLETLNNSSLIKENALLENFANLAVEEFSQSLEIVLWEEISHEDDFTLLNVVSKLYKIIENKSFNPAYNSKIRSIDLTNVRREHQIYFCQDIKNITFVSCLSLIQVDPNAMIFLISQNTFLKPIELFSNKIDDNNIDSMLKILKQLKVINKSLYPDICSTYISQYSSVDLICQMLEDIFPSPKLTICILSSEDLWHITHSKKKAIDGFLIVSNLNQFPETFTQFYSNTHNENQRFIDDYNAKGISAIIEHTKRQDDIVKFFDKYWGQYYTLIDQFAHANGELQNRFLTLCPKSSNLKFLLGLIKNQTITLKDLLYATSSKSDFSLLKHFVMHIPDFKQYLLQHWNDWEWSRIIIHKCQNHLESNAPTLRDIFTDTHLKSVALKGLLQHSADDDGSNLRITRIITKELFSSLEEFQKYLAQLFWPECKTHFEKNPIQEGNPLEKYNSLEEYMFLIIEAMGHVLSNNERFANSQVLLNNKKFAKKYLLEINTHINHLVDEILFSNKSVIFSESLKKDIKERLFAGISASISHSIFAAATSDEICQQISATISHDRSTIIDNQLINRCQKLAKSIHQKVSHRIKEFQIALQHELEREEAAYKRYQQIAFDYEHFEEGSSHAQIKQEITGGIKVSDALEFF